MAGGLAVNAHGYLRFTKDVDIVLDLSPRNIQQAVGRPQDLADVDQLKLRLKPGE